MKMFKTLVFSVLLTLVYLGANAQTIIKLKEVQRLQMPVGDGSNGAGVAWNAHNKMYYACFAGNESFPLAIFDKEGQLQSDENLSVGFDARGIWYEPKINALVGNAYNEEGWFRFNLDEKGVPTAHTSLKKGLNQPDANSIGCHSVKHNLVYFLNGQTLHAYANGDAKASKNIRLYIGKTKKPKLSKSENEDDDLTLPDDYNSNAVVCTGIKNAEFGVLSFKKGQIELYSAKSGLLTKILEVPERVMMGTSFNFAFANGHYWLFNKKERVWIGLK